MIPNACVVEVIERVPDADVAIVAARVGERLGMPQERVRQLIDGRTGPITRALRPEKADAIAQTFEAAGVRVVIRAADADEIEEARAAGGPAKPPEEAPEPAADGPEQDLEAAGDAETAREPDGDPEHEAEPDAERDAEPDAEPHAERDAEPGAAFGPDAEPEPEPEPEPAFGRDPELDPEPEPAFAPEPEVDAEPGPERDPAVDLDPAPDRDLDLDPDLEMDPDLDADFDADLDADPDLDRDPDPDPDPDRDPDPDPSSVDDLVPGPDAPSEQGLAREVAYIFATGEAPAWRGPVEDLDAPDPDEEAWTDEGDDGDGAGHEARGEVTRTGEARAPDAFPPVGGWDAEGAGAWSTRRAAADAGGVAGAADRSRDVPEFAIGRASRRPRDGASESRAPAAPAAPDAHPIDLPVDGDEPVAAFEEAPMAPASRPVPTAWRGLGGAEAGPARPPSARLPRREDAVEEPRFVFDEPPVRRRAVMLAALGVAVVLFVLAQWWVASRAGAAGVDPYDAYRRGEFAAARAAWDAEAAAGDPSARFMLGYLAEAGLGAPWSARTAAGWYRAAAEGGHAEAMWRLARLYEVGLGVVPDTLEARRWYRSAAQAGHAEAAFAWGRVVLHDAGVALGAGAAPRLPAATAAEAASAFERATELGWHEAAPYAAAFAALGVEAP